MLCMRRYAESRVEKKKQQAYAVTNSSEFKEGTTLTHVSSRIKRCKTGTRLLSPRIQLTMGNEVSGKCGRLLHLCGLHSSALKGLQLLWRPGASESVWSLVSGYAMFTTSSSNFTPFKLRAGRTGSCAGRLLLCTLVNRCCGCRLCAFTFHCFPSVSIFDHFDPCVVVLYFVAFHLFSFLWLEEFIGFVSSNLFFGLPTCLYVWCSMLRPGFHSAGSYAFLIAKRHVIQSCMEFWLLSSFQRL